MKFNYKVIENNKIIRELKNHDSGKDPAASAIMEIAETLKNMARYVHLGHLDRFSIAIDMRDGEGGLYLETINEEKEDVEKKEERTGKGSAEETVNKEQINSNECSGDDETE